MRIRTRDAILFLCATAFTMACQSGEAAAASPGPQHAKSAAHAARPAVSARQAPARHSTARKNVASSARYYRGPVLQCVTFARDASGVHLSGNAHAWWYNAAGQFDRGQRPEVGAVLNFRSSGGMRLGHVSVVSRVLSSREVLVDDANWAGPGQRKGMVRRGASVIDVSANNDWTMVRVANGIGSWGREYPTYGFIYPRADRSGGFERIEIAADRDVRARPAASRVAPASAASSGWFWQGGSGVQAALPAPQRLASPPARWTWVNGQAVARD